MAVRIGRRDVITRDSPAQYVALIGEAALRQLLGSREMMREQFKYLLEMARRPNIDIRVFRFSSGWHPALEGPFHLIESDVTTVVHLENRKSGLFLHEDTDVRTYRRAAERVLDVAMNPVDSAKLVKYLADSTENGNEC